jgi:hypothetical protein
LRITKKVPGQQKSTETQRQQSKEESSKLSFQAGGEEIKMLSQGKPDQQFQLPDKPICFRSFKSIGRFWRDREYSIV